MDNYHDYIIKEGEFIGAFEEMYQKVEDPWHHGDATAIHYEIALYLLKRYNICASGGLALDIGCGKGAFTARLKENLHKDTKILGLDIAPTAIRKAKEKYGYERIDFRVCDIIKNYGRIDVPLRGVDLMIMSDIMWYVLPSFKTICKGIRRYLKNDGYLLINQTFYPPEKQKYGREIVSSVEDMLNIIHMKIVEMVETNRLLAHHAVILFRNED